MSGSFETPDTVYEIILHNVLHFAAISTLYYDHLLTSRYEIDYFWRRPMNRGSCYFFLNRYFSFFGNIAVSILGFLDLPTQSCKRYNTFRQTLLVVTQVLVCYFMTLRIYALYECSIRVLTGILSSGAVLVTVSCWALFGQKSAPTEFGTGCHIGMSKITAIHLAVAWEALLVFDSIIFGLTLYKTWSKRREYITGNRSVPPLVTLILRDGAVYFAVMGLANLSNILSFYLGGPFFRGALSTLASNISVTMMSRLMLNLRGTAESRILSTQRTTNGEAGVRNSEERREDVVELDTILTENTGCDPYTTRGSVAVPGLEKIDEEQGASSRSTEIQLSGEGSGERTLAWVG